MIKKTMHFSRFRDIREDTDKKQEELARVIKTSQSYYAQYERGERPISLERALIIADYYNVSLDYITGRTNKKEINR